MKTSHGTYNCAVFGLSNLAQETLPFFYSLLCSSCCASRFTWASTSDNAAQEARDKHNCRSCGTLVCDPCSKNRVPVPSVGLTVAVRVCDRCYNDMDGRGANCPVTSAFPLRQGSQALPERQRPRRSAVVDDLAARVLTTPTGGGLSSKGSVVSSS